MIDGTVSEREIARGYSDGLEVSTVEAIGSREGGKPLLLQERRFFNRKFTRKASLSCKNL